MPPTPEVWNAAFRLENPIVSVIKAMTQARPSAEWDPDYNPWDAIKNDPEAWEQREKFIHSPNLATTQAWQAQIHERNEAARTLSAAGWAGTMALLLAALLNPIYIVVAQFGYISRKIAYCIYRVLRRFCFGINTFGSSGDAPL